MTTTETKPGQLCVELHCPRCCSAPGCVANILTRTQREFSLKCSEKYPCAWRKDHRPEHRLETHDMIVLAIDKLQIAMSAYLLSVGAIHSWHWRITQPTKPMNVFQDAEYVIHEVTGLLNQLKEKSAPRAAAP